jgi:hypothetical protein
MISAEPKHRHFGRSEKSLFDFVFFLEVQRDRT